MSGINIRDLKRIPIVVPPPDEQSQIVGFLDNALRDLDAVSSRAKAELTLLNEYETRLAADVITGRLDVRDAAAKLPEEAGVEAIPDDAELDEDVQTVEDEVAA